jgi:hypothetical protein
VTAQAQAASAKLQQAHRQSVTEALTRELAGQDGRRSKIAAGSSKRDNLREEKIP